MMRRFLSFRGREGRGYYVAAVLLSLLCLVVPALLTASLGIALENAVSAVVRSLDRAAAHGIDWARPSAWLMIAVLLASLALSIWLLFAAVVRRLHDLGRSGWHVAWLVGALLLEALPSGVLGSVAGYLSIMMLVLLALLPGERGANRFGPLHGAAQGT